MSLNVCAHCTTKFAVGLPHCPQCGNADYYEEGSMAKITRHGGATTVQDIRAEPAAEVVEESVEVVEEQPVLSGYATWLRTDLQDECEARGLAKSGNKDDLIARLDEDDVAKSQAPVEAGESEAEESESE
jgi:hypothetical protein